MHILAEAEHDLSIWMQQNGKRQIGRNISKKRRAFLLEQEVPF
jgi:hypothetical protein